MPRIVLFGLFTLLGSAIAQLTRDEVRRAYRGAVIAHFVSHGSLGLSLYIESVPAVRKVRWLEYCLQLSHDLLLRYIFRLPGEQTTVTHDWEGLSCVCSGEGLHWWT